MPLTEEMLAHLAGIPNLSVFSNVPLSRHTRFGIGGPADIYAETSDESVFSAAFAYAQSTGLPILVIGDGTNLIVSDQGFRGIVLRFRAADISAQNGFVSADSGATLQSLVDFTVARGLRGLETLAGIPGSVGAAVYGNAGAYGHSISERVNWVRFFNGAAGSQTGVCQIDNAACQFQYRESVFKRQKDWIIFSTGLTLDPADAAALTETASGIVKVRNEKFPPTMKCAGSIFKNQLVKDLPPDIAELPPPSAVREGKIPSAWFLEQVGAKGLKRGGIHVADYHANLIYNDGGGTAADLVAVIADLKTRVHNRFGIELEEEVQYAGF
jgi:UDP-N-acetylmuramate dehydrogenase